MRRVLKEIPIDKLRYSGQDPRRIIDEVVRNFWSLGYLDVRAEEHLNCEIIVVTGDDAALNVYHPGLDKTLADGRGPAKAVAVQQQKQPSKLLLLLS